MAEVSKLIASMGDIPLEEALKAIADSTGYTLKQVQSALDIAIELSEKEIPFYEVYNTRWITRYRSNDDVLIHLIDFLNTDASITDKLFQGLTQDALDKGFRDLKFLEDAYIRPEMKAIRRRWLKQAQDLINSVYYESSELHKNGTFDGMSVISIIFGTMPHDYPEMSGLFLARIGIIERLRTYVAAGGSLERDMIANAALHGRLDCVKYLHEKGCVVKIKALLNACRNGHLACLKYLCEECHYDISNETPLCSEAAGYGQLECLKYLRSRDPPTRWDEHAFGGAAFKGHFHVMKYLLQGDSHGSCQWDGDTLYMAVYHGNLENIKWLVENGCPADEGAASAAVRGDRLDILKYFVEHGLPWDHKIYIEAMKMDYFHIVKYAHEHGCPWNADVYHAAVIYRRPDCIQYLQEHGCPQVDG